MLSCSGLREDFWKEWRRKVVDVFRIGQDRGCTFLWMTAVTTQGTESTQRELEQEWERGLGTYALDWEDRMRVFGSEALGTVCFCPSGLPVGTKARGRVVYC